jgi:hypothetical protein
MRNGVGSSLRLCRLSMADAMPVLFALMAAFPAAFTTIVVEIVFQKSNPSSFSLHAPGSHSGYRVLLWIKGG